MITITKRKDGYSVVGHANYAEHGQDIVCASVSALTQTTALGLMMFTQPEVERKDGELHVKIHETSPEINALINTMFAGLIKVEEQYPKYVKVEGEQ